MNTPLEMNAPLGRVQDIITNHDPDQPKADFFTAMSKVFGVAVSGQKTTNHDNGWKTVKLYFETTNHYLVERIYQLMVGKLPESQTPALAYEFQFLGVEDYDYPGYPTIRPCCVIAWTTEISQENDQYWEDLAKSAVDELLHADPVQAAVDVFIDMCDHGHKFAKLPDHPVNGSGRPRCPHCLVKGLEHARTELSDHFSAITMTIRDMGS